MDIISDNDPVEIREWLDGVTEFEDSPRARSS